MGIEEDGGEARVEPVVVVEEEGTGADFSRYFSWVLELMLLSLAIAKSVCMRDPMCCELSTHARAQRHRGMQMLCIKVEVWVYQVQRVLLDLYWEYVECH